MIISVSDQLDLDAFVLTLIQEVPLCAAERHGPGLASLQRSAIASLANARNATLESD
jgi:hypothetical protein